MLKSSPRPPRNDPPSHNRSLARLFGPPVPVLPVCRIYRNFGKSEGEWIRNEHGGDSNLEAVSLLRELNNSMKAGIRRGGRAEG